MAADGVSEQPSAATTQPGKRTETVVREFNEAGKMTREVTTTVVLVNADEDKPWPGQYL